MSRAVKANNGQIFDIASQTTCNVFKIFLHRSVYIDGAPARRTDDNFVHVNVRSIKQTTSFGRREHGDRIIGSERTEICALERIDGYIDLWKFRTGLV